ncbi:MAG: AAA family ATPase, partial [Candidatus Calescibacterium sp.]|nr:AAA family ATPase [Candidatus Calescibacterium sp.]
MRIRRRLPIGIQSFVEIRRGGYYYVDKTRFVLKLAEEGKYYFLSRPRRFGKSLFLDTLKQAFLGRRELFEGLYLERNWDWSRSYPVIHIDFAGGVVSDEEDLRRWFLYQMKLNYQELGIDLVYDDPRISFSELVIRAYHRYKTQVVVLVDEYDKPILDRIDDADKSIKIREELRNIYSVLKPLDEYLRFVFITG